MAENKEHRAWLRIVDGPSEEWHLDPDFNPLSFKVQDPEALTQPYWIRFAAEEVTDLEELPSTKRSVGRVPLATSELITVVYNFEARSGWLTWTWKEVESDFDVDFMVHEVANDFEVHAVDAA